MKRIVLIVALLCALPAVAQNTALSNSDFVSGTQCVSVSAGNLTQGSYSLTGSWTGTVTAYGAVGQGALVSLGSQTANGSYLASIAGYTLFKVCGNTVSAGMAFVQVFASIPGGNGTINPNSGSSANPFAAYVANGGSSAIGPSGDFFDLGSGSVNVGGAGIGNGGYSVSGSVSGTLVWGCNANACTTWLTASPIQTTSTAGISSKHLTQIAANNYAGTCTLVSGTCTVTLNSTYTTPLCGAFRVSGTLTGILTASLSTTTLTISSSVGSDTAVVWGFCMGDPT